MMINRSILKRKISDFSKGMKADEFKLHENNLEWINLLSAGKIPFCSHGSNFNVDFKKINFTGPEINNQEWRAQLNRFLWLGPCLGEDLSGESEYFARISVDSINSFYNFRKNIHVPDKKILWEELGDNTLSISIRLGKRYGLGWWGTIPFMRESVVSDEFIARMYDSTMGQIDFMISNMTSCGNWRISQLSCLLFIGYIFNNDTWISIAVNGLNEAFFSQVADDGCHEEHTIGYHLWMAKEFSSLYYLSYDLPELKLDINLKKLIRMWEYVIISSCPDGQYAGLNDDIRWGYVNKEESRKNLAYAKTTRKNLIERFTDEKVVDVDMESRYFESAGQWYLKNENDNIKQMFIFDATRYGGGHCHRAVNSIDFYYGNKMILLDPGTFNYERNDKFFEYGKQTISHNTVTVDGMSQIPSSINESVYDVKGKCVFVYNVYSNGYESATGFHERLLFWYKDEICLVNDVVKCNGKKFRTNFNFLPGNHHFDGSNFYTGFEDYNLMISPIYSNIELEASIYEGSLNPMAGWISKDGYKLGGAEKSPSLAYEGRLVEWGSVVAYALIPFVGSIKPIVSMDNIMELHKEDKEDIKAKRHNQPACYTITVNGKTFGIVSAYLKHRDSRLHPSIGKTGKYESDGKLAFIEVENGKIVFAYLYEGTYLKYNNEVLIQEAAFGNYEKNL